jgi:hypothetical protein
MKELNQNEYIETGDYEPIAERSERSHPSENYTIRLYDTGRGKDRYILEVIEADKYQYSYDDEDVSNPQAIVDEAVRDWINNTIDDPINNLIARYAWGLIDHFDEVAEDYTGDCAVIWMGNYYEYTPVGCTAKYHNNPNPRVFSTFEAREHKSAKRKESYVLSCNEAGRPSHYIIPYPKG